MIEQRLRRAALFLVPTAILGLSPELIPLAVVGTVGYLAAAYLLRRQGGLHLGWLFVLIAGIYLLADLSGQPYVNDYGRSKVLFVVFLVFPFGLAVSQLLESQDDLRAVLWGFVAVSMVVTPLSILAGTRSILGEQRYQWQGNLNAIAAVILLQFWLVKNRKLAVAMLVVALAGVAGAAAKQSLGVLAVGLTANMAAHASFRRGRWREVLLVVLLGVLGVASWGILRNLPLLQTLLARLAAMRTPTGGFNFLQRQLMFVKAGRCFLSHPVTGIGPGEFMHYPGYTAELPGEIHLYPHDTMIEILCEQGLVGFGFLIVPLLLFAVYLFFAGRRPGGEPLYATLLLFLCAVTMAGLTGDLTSRPIWIFGILMMRMVSLVRREAPAPAAQPPLAQEGWSPPGSPTPEAGRA